MKRTFFLLIALMAVPGWGETPSSAKSNEGTRFSDVAEKAVKSVVNISSVKVIRYSNEPLSPFFSDPFFRQFFGEDFGGFDIPRERRERSLGSGVIVSKEGYILTNNHVVSDATEISVTLPGGAERKGKIVGTDPKTDVALVKLDETKGMAPIPLGNSDALRLAEQVLAIGSPFGLQQTVTIGIVSALGRANVGIADYEDFIQTDAAINPGNSGGALINLKGELVGINTAIFSQSGGYQGIGFAIPINMAKFVMDQLILHGKVERGWLGVNFQEMTNDLAKAFGLSSPKGTIISKVMPRSPAAKAGLQAGDVILSMDDKSIRDTAHFRNLLSETSIGQKMKLQILRDKKVIAVEATIEKIPQEEPKPSPRRRRMH